MSTYKTMVPILYKYFPPERVDVLERCRIRFTQVAAFNDPFEARPFVRGVVGDENLLRTIMQRLQGVWQGHYKTEEVPPGIMKALNAIIQMRDAKISEELLNRIYQEINNELGVLSLTEHKDNLLMWAHYARSHEGFVVGFKQNDLWLSEEGGGTEIRKIHYSTDRPATSMSKMSRLEWFFVKGRTWSYEDEWRAIRPLSEAVERRPASPFDICLFEFPGRCVQEVVLGARTSAATRQRLVTALRCGMYEDVRILQAAIHGGEYRLVYSPPGNHSDVEFNLL